MNVNRASSDDAGHTDDTVAPDTAELLLSIKRRLSVVAFIGIVAALYFAKDIVLPITLGVLIALTLSPIVRVFNRVGIPTALSAAVVLLSLGLCVTSLAYFVSAPITTWVEDAPSIGRQLEWKLRGLSETLEAVQDTSDQIDKLSDNAKKSDVQEVVIAQPGLLTSAVSTLSSMMTSAIVSFVLAFFVLASNTLFYEKLIGSFPKFGDKKKALGAVYDIERKVSRYLLTITMINACLGAAIGSALFVLGMPDAFIWGVVAFLLNYIPFVGMAIGVVLVGIFAIIAFDTMSYAMLVPLSYFVLNAIEGQFITPLTVGRALDMNAVAVLLTVVFWGWLWGIAGALMAVPFLVLVKVVCDNAPSLQTFGSFLASRNNDVDDQAIS